MSFLKNKDNHPSYATLAFNRTSGGSTNLFGSSIQHRDTITMYVREGEISRELNNDYIFGGNRILELEMSYSQFAEAITSMNQGTGVPVTLRYLQGKGKIEGCPFVDKRKQFEDEFANTLNKTNESVNKLISEVEDIFIKKSLTKADKENVSDLLRKIKYGIGCNSEFVYTQFNEQMDKTVRESKGEIEAFFQNKVSSIASMALVEHKDDLAKLENPIKAEE